jgi:hypothetical protein
MRMISDIHSGVNFIQMTLGFGELHKLLDALVEGASFTEHIGTRAERGADALFVQ